ncbi:sphingomyelin catabolic process [Trichomonas vaginalis G3]|nr:sphingomyelin catabolic process [Trichomonas vaginalis G3]KAI5549728.1 sphingomyelin catabolic process [Trichomonas vaginalis G3]
MLYFSDIHYDIAYNPIKPSKTWCHDITNETAPYSKYGKYGCESPKALVDAFFSDLKRIISGPRLIMCGGDTTNTWKQTHTFDKVIKNINTVVENMRKIYPNVPFIYNLGNGDYYPSYGAFDTDKEQFSQIADTLGDYLTAEQKKNFSKGGYYYYDEDHHLIRIISFNSIIYTINRKLISEDDPYDQFKFLKEALQTKFHKVLLFHMHPGITDPEKPLEWHQKFIDQFAKILNENPPDTILSAHTHFDMLMPIHGTDLISLSNPGISPRLGNNPAFRVYHFTRGQLLDYFQYNYDLSQRDEIPKWKFEYKFTETYKHKYISQMALKQTIKWVNKSLQNFQLYLSHLHAGGTHNMWFYKCVMIINSNEDYQKCINQFF